MHKLTDPHDLRKYLQTRLRIINKNARVGRDGTVQDPYTKGMIFGIEQSLQAVEDVIAYQQSHKKEG